MADQAGARSPDQYCGAPQQKTKIPAGYHWNRQHTARGDNAMTGGTFSALHCALGSTRKKISRAMPRINTNHAATSLHSSPGTVPLARGRPSPAKRPFRLNIELSKGVTEFASCRRHCTRAESYMNWAAAIEKNDPSCTGEE